LKQEDLLRFVNVYAAFENATGPILLDALAHGRDDDPSAFRAESDFTAGGHTGRRAHVLGDDDPPAFCDGHVELHRKNAKQESAGEGGQRATAAICTHATKPQPQASSGDAACPAEKTQTRSRISAMPCPTPMHMVHSA
jgi:hypothetical protein